MYAMLSTRSSTTNYQLAFRRLRVRYPTWRDLASARVGRLASTIRVAGLANRKARALRSIAKRIFVEDQRLDLEFLRSYTTRQARNYLLGLPEVGPKIANCVLLYALDRPVLPLDVHNRRILQRLGLARLGETAEDVERRIPSAIRMELHVNLIAHGRAVCTPTPQCSSCVLADVCPAVR